MLLTKETVLLESSLMSMKAVCVVGDHSEKSCLKHPATSVLKEVALLHFRSSRRKSLSGSPRSAKLVLACPQTSWDCPNNLRPLNAGATASWIDLASPSEGERQLLKNFHKTIHSSTLNKINNKAFTLVAN